MYSLIARHLLAPLLDFSRGTRTIKCLKELNESQWWSRSKILELQNDRLRQLVEHAYKNVPYYRQIFHERAIKPGDIASSEDLAKLPILTKKLIRHNFNDMVSRGFPKKEIITQSTGGSTGEQLMFYRTKDERMNWNIAASLRGYAWAGCEIGDKCIRLGQIPQYHSLWERTSESAKLYFERTMRFNAAGMSAETMPSIAAKIYNFQPEFIRGYPSAIYLLARFIEKEGKYKLKPRAIFTGAELLYGYQRKLFRKIFGCETYSHYNSFEIHPIAVECPEHSGHHITAENVIIEIVNDGGETVLPGNEGRILVTNLHNYAMPFIRYDIGDLGALSEHLCPCGRGLPLLSKLIGRADDMIITRSGKRIPGTAFPREFLAFLGVEQCQIIQESYEELTIKLVIDRNYPQEHINKLTQDILNRYKPIVREDMDITIDFVERIPLTKAGKHKVVISKLPSREIGSIPYN